MSDLLWAAIIASVPPTLTVLISNRQQNKKTDVVVKKVDEVHALANDRLSKALEKIQELTLRLDRLKNT